MTVKAFVSHATVDQDRFVRGLAERLQDNGVETWYAEWALLDGDSLVKRIFTEAIAESDVFIVVLSANTVQSHWVQAELDVGVVRSIERSCRLIPIVIDDVQVPVALQATKYRRIADVTSYDNDFDGLLRSIFNRPTTPPLGSPPAYTSASAIKGLSAADATVYQQIVTLAIETDTLMVQGDDIYERCTPLGISDAAVLEAAHAIDDLGWVREGHIYVDRVQFVLLRLRSIRDYVARTRDLNSIERRLVAEVVNHNDERRSLADIAAAVGVEPVVAESILDRFDRRYLNIMRTYGGTWITNVSTLLARRLD